MPGTAARLCSLALLLLAAKASLTAADKNSRPKTHHPAKKLSFGNLRKLYLEGGAGGYRLNGVDLLKLPGSPIYLNTADQAFRVRVTFLETVLVSKGEPLNINKKALVQDWERRIPFIAETLKKKDSIGSVKPVVYDLIAPLDRNDVKLQEELVLLWSADRIKRMSTGDTTLMPPSPFPGKIKGDTALMAAIPFSKQVTDVQYRGLQGGVDQLIGKIILQILYIRDHSKHFLLVGFVIVSKPSGEYEFYLVPRNLLERIVMD